MLSDAILYAVVLGLTALVALGTVFLGQRFPHRLSLEQRNLLASKAGLFTNLYTFFLGFAVVTLWTSYNDVSHDVIKEAYMVKNLFHYSKSLSDSKDFQQDLVEYAQHVAQVEWPLMTQEKPVSTDDPVYERLWEDLRRMHPAPGQDLSVYALVLDKMGDLSVYRHYRLDQVQGHLYKPIWAIIYMGLVFAMGGFYYSSLEHVPADAYYAVTICAMILGNIFLLYELDGPFSGLVRILPTKFEEVRQAMLAMGIN